MGVHAGSGEVAWVSKDRFNPHYVAQMQPVHVHRVNHYLEISP